MNHKLYDQKGYVALMAVLIIGAAVTAIATTLLVFGVDSSRQFLAEQQSAQARKLADACGDEALQQIHDSTLFTGTNSLTLATGTCSYTVTNIGGQTRSVDASATIGSVVRKIKVYATIGVSSISITSWQDVS